MAGGLTAWETTGVFVVDDLVDWLIGWLANAGYQKLITRLRGSDQARALKVVATVAVRATVREIGLSDGEEAERLAGQINKAFGKRDPVALPQDNPRCWKRCRPGSPGNCLFRMMRGRQL